MIFPNKANSSYIQNFLKFGLLHGKIIILHYVNKNFVTLVPEKYIFMYIYRKYANFDCFNYFSSPTNLVRPLLPDLTYKSVPLFPQNEKLCE